MAQLSVVTLWSCSSIVHGELADYLLAESFPVPTRFIWVVNTQYVGAHRLLHAAATRLRSSGHHVETIDSSDRPEDGLLGKHQHVANLYNMVLPRIETEWVLTVEDDNLPRIGAYAMAAEFLSANERCGAVCGLYRSRMNPENACAALATDRWRKVPRYAEVSRTAQRVGFIGAGFTLYRLAAFRSGAPFHPGLIDKSFHGWDANLCLQMRETGWDLYLHGAIRVGHCCREVLIWCAHSGEPVG